MKDFIYKPVTLNWQQITLFKLSLLSLGIILGVWYGDFFANHLNLLAGLFLIPGFYLVYVWLKQ